MEKKKNRKKKNKKITAKIKAREKAKALKVKLKEKAKKEKNKVKKTKTKSKNAKTAAGPETGKDEKVTSSTTISESKTSGISSLSVNAQTAVLKIKSLGNIEAINNYIAGDERVTIKQAATSKIASLSGK